MRLTKLFNDFFESEKGGVLLIVCTIISLLLANSSAQRILFEFVAFQIAGLCIENWINEGLMAVFFFLIGLELKREIYVGELSHSKNAMLPVFAAVGGMIIPAANFRFFQLSNYHTIRCRNSDGNRYCICNRHSFSFGKPRPCFIKNFTYRHCGDR